MTTESLPLAVFDTLVREHERPFVDEGEDKVMPLATAVQELVRPGMSLYFSFAHARAHAAAAAITRRFWATQPEFHLVTAGVLEFGLVMMHGGLVTRVTTAFAGNTYPTPGPNRVFGRAVAKGRVVLEEATNLTLTTRLMAGAFGFPFTPTRSFSGTSLATAANGYAEIADPFGGNKRLGLLKALRPDLAVVHAFAADRAGNAIVLGPYGEDTWGSFASRGGVLLTVEKIVSTDVIRRHAHLVRIPSHAVRSVSVCPLGAHPQPMTTFGLEEADSEAGYAEDYEFRKSFVEATRSDESLDTWIRTWILDCADHAEYVRRLGPQRLAALREGLAEDVWKARVAAKRTRLHLDAASTPAEMMVVLAAREVARRVRACRHRTVLAGAGVANLAAGLAVMKLKREGADVELMTEAGSFGFLPRFGDPYVFNVTNMFTNKMHSSFAGVLGVLACGAANRCLSVIGAGQIDARGNINSTLKADGSFLVGSGGANDLGNGAQEIVVLSAASRGRLVESVPYITTSGERVSALVTPLGVFEKSDTGRLELARLAAGKGSDNAALERLLEDCEWPLAPPPDLPTEPPPTAEELAMVRLYDPDRTFTR